MASSSEAVRRATQAQAKYDATHTRRIALKLNLQTDADIIEYLESQPSMQGAIKEAIRDKMQK